MLKMSSLMLVLIICGVSQAQSWPLMRDERVIVDLLSNGEIDLSKNIAKVMGKNQGITRIRRIGLTKDGQEIRAAFRDDVIYVNEGNRTGEKFYDAYYNELAAYTISKYLGLNIIPITILRRLPISDKGLNKSKKMRQGSLQIWVENSVVEFEYSVNNRIYFGNKEHKNNQLKEIIVFDCIIGNVDRHGGNLLVDLNKRVADIKLPVEEQQQYLGKIWAIDHSSAFHQKKRLNSRYCKLKNYKKHAISLTFMRNLRTWNIKDVEADLRSTGLSEKQLKRLNLSALDYRAQEVKNYLETEQKKRHLSDEEYYSSGVWHDVW